MIYLLAFVVGLIVCVQGFFSEILAGNIAHIKNGRIPNAGTALFPSVPIVPLLVIGTAWLLRVIIPEYAIWTLLSLFALFSTFWGLSFAKLKFEFHSLTASPKHTNED